MKFSMFITLCQSGDAFASLVQQQALIENEIDTAVGHENKQLNLAGERVRYSRGRGA